MPQLNLQYVLDQTRRLQEEKDSDPLRVFCLRNVTMEGIKPYLDYFIWTLGRKPDVLFCQYDNIMQDTLNPSSELYTHNPHAIILNIKLENYLPSLISNFCSLHELAWKTSLNEIQTYILSIIKSIRSNGCTAPILLHNFESPAYAAFGVLDAQNERNQIGFLSEANHQLREIAKTNQSVFIVDVASLSSRIGAVNYFDPRYWYLGKAPYSKTALPVIAHEYSRFFRAILGKTKKCLVLDLDNTLWGGVLGEVGFNGIKLGGTYPGVAFSDFQKAILDLHNRGILLAIASKNDHHLIMEVIETHPEMILKREHFAVIKANWEDKASNIRDIALELNIGLDSLVFVDDNPFEIELVATMLPMVETVLLPKDPATYPSLLREQSFFDSLLFSDEDRNRTKMYHAEKERKNLQDKVKNLDDYLTSLEMELYIHKIDTFAVSRVAQLTQRTNQFNLRTIRYTDGDIEAFVKQPHVDVRYFKLIDKFGDSGIVGAAIVKYEGSAAYIDTFLLSCRVIGRGIEDVVLSYFIDRAKIHGVTEIFGEYIQTSKNSMVKDLYPSRGFTIVTSEGHTATYGLRLDKQADTKTTYFKKIHFIE